MVPPGGRINLALSLRGVNIPGLIPGLSVPVRDFCCPSVPILPNFKSYDDRVLRRV
jgi:hypothetical protein